MQCQSLPVTLVDYKQTLTWIAKKELVVNTNGKQSAQCCKSQRIGVFQY